MIQPVLVKYELRYCSKDRSVQIYIIFNLLFVWPAIRFIFAYLFNIFRLKSAFVNMNMDSCDFTI